MKNLKSLNIIWIILLVLTIQLISAAPPVTTVSYFTEGYVIKAPQVTVLEQNSPFEFEVHVFNISNGAAKISGIGCYFHLYNSTGKHVYEAYDATPSHNFDYSFDVSGTNFSKLGYMNYIIQCNGSVLGGYIAQELLITPNGDEITTGKAIIDLCFLILLLFIFALFVLIFIKSKNIALSVGMFGGMYLLAVIITFTAWNVADNYVTAATFLTAIFRWAFIILMLSALPLLIFAFIYYLFAFRRIKELRRLFDKGFSWEEANRRVKNG